MLKSPAWMKMSPSGMILKVKLSYSEWVSLMQTMRTCPGWTGVEMSVGVCSRVNFCFFDSSVKASVGLWDRGWTVIALSILMFATALKFCCIKRVDAPG